MATLLVATLVLEALVAPPPQRVAVIGGGLAGLGCAFHLLNSSTHPLDVDVFDPCTAGEGGASAVAAGLLHPFTPKGREIWQGLAGYIATRELLAAVTEVEDDTEVFYENGLLRLAKDKASVAELGRSVQSGRTAPSGVALEQRWLSLADAEELAAGVLGGMGAAHAPHAVSVDTPSYLRALWALCERLAATAGATASWRREPVRSLRALRAAGLYDAVVVAAGSRCAEIEELASLPLRLCRGQNLRLSNAAGLAVPLICGKYVVPLPSGELLCGATFEYDAAERAHRPAEPALADEALRSSLSAMHPPIAEAALLGGQAGVRALPPRSHLGYVPIAGRLPLHGAGDCWILTGLGSRGLIHHALLGRAVARAVLSGDEGLVPEHARRLAGRLPGLLEGEANE